MDPAQALQNAVDALKVNDAPAADEYLLAYRTWRSRGGFEPTWCGPEHHELRGDELAALINTALNYHAVRVVAERAVDMALNSKEDRR